MPFFYGLLIWWSVLLLACTNKVQAKFVLVNNSGQSIDSVQIMPDVDQQYISLANGEQKEIEINMTGIAKTDGAYGLQFKIRSVKTNYVFGYNTNGYPLEDYTVITIEQDTILVKPHYDY